ncbi:MAG: glycosyltransferase [Anaerolineaceae bacterium]|nr:glycosyltransferase [Anaerolineaceae bacterium]MCB9100227.1 glycosyltransferase [Anaerolineales bacterium]
MKLLYHMTNLPPRIQGTEASLQELNILRQHFGGELIHLNPNEQSPIYLPRLLFGFHQLKRIRAAEASIDAHHLYNADPFPFPIARRLRKPVIYSISSGVRPKRPNIPYFNSLAAVTVSDQRSFDQMTAWGIRNCFLVRHGIDTEQFSVNPLPLDGTFKMMVGSAPWTMGQFVTKGIDALLTALQKAPWLHLVFLWRGVLFEEIVERIRRMGLEKRVEIINQRIEVNTILARVHASVALATDPAIIKAYPHSLIESLAAGKPILLSRSIPMADYVEQHGCGQLIDNVTPEAILAAIEGLIQNYQGIQQAVVQRGASDFSHQAMIDSFKMVYDAVLSHD